MRGLETIRFVALVALSAPLGCGRPPSEAQGPGSPAKTQSTVAPSAVASVEPAPAPAVTALPSGWFDPDALPPGARGRIGSRRFLGAAPVAVSPTGRMASHGSDSTVLEHREDGHVRVVGKCTPYDLRFVDEELVMLCFQGVIRWRDDASTTTPFACEGGGALSANGRFAVCASSKPSEMLRVFDATTGERRWEVASKLPRKSVISDGGTVFTLSDEGAIRRLDEGLTTWMVASELADLSFDAARERLVGSNRSREELHVFDGKSGRRLLAVKDKHGADGGFAFLPDGSWVTVLGGEQGQLVTFSPQGKVKRSVALPQYGSAGVATSSNGRYAFTGRIHRVDLKSGELLPSKRWKHAVGLASSPSGDELAVAYYGGALRVFDARRLTERANGSGPNAGMRDLAMAYSAKGDLLIAADAYGDLTTLDAKTLTPRCTVRSDEVRTTWLYRLGDTIALVHFGKAADDEQFVGGGLTLLNDSCKVLAHQASEGLVEPSRANADSVEALFFAFYDPEFDPRPWVPASERVDRAYRVDARTRTISQLPPAEVARAAAAALAAEKLYEDEGRRTTESTSADGSTRLVVTEEDWGRISRWTCTDISSGRTRTGELQHSPSLLALAGDGSWFAVKDVPSVLVFDCKP